MLPLVNFGQKMTTKTFRAIHTTVFEAVRQKIVEKNFRAIHVINFQLRSILLTLFLMKAKKSEVDQNQPWHAIKTGFAKQLWKVSMQLTGFEGRLWPKMAKKGPKTFRAIHVNSVLPISVFIIPYNVLVTSSVVHSNYCVHL